MEASSASTTLQALAARSRLGDRRSRTTLSEDVAAEIESLILRGELANGQRLPTENEMGEFLGVSRSVVRDAVRALAARGLVTVRQGHGTAVSAPSSETYGDAMVALLMRSNLRMHDVVAARAALETELGPLAARRGNADDWDKIGAHLERFTAALDDEAWAVVHEENLRFHLGIFSALHLPALELLLAPIQQCIILTSLPPGPSDREMWGLEDHRQILDALRSGDQDATRAALERHFASMETERYERFNATPFQEGAALDVYRSYQERGGT
jgi:GntR family transcriptional repressor for pyruvate dehydrogenase complex